MRLIKSLFIARLAAHYIKICFHFQSAKDAKSYDDEDDISKDAKKKCSQRRLWPGLGGKPFFA